MTLHFITHHQFLVLLILLAFTCTRAYHLCFFELLHLHLHHLLDFVHAYRLALSVLIYLLELLHYLLDVGVCVSLLEILD